MSGHSHWAGIKHQKEITDKKRGVVFSKLLVAIAAAAKSEPDPNFNPRLRSAIEKARENKVPAENIDRAIARASASGEGIEELICEGYGPGGAAILIEAATDNRNRAIQEIKKIIHEHGGKWAEPGSVRWAFEAGEGGGWKAKFPQSIEEEDRGALISLVRALEDQNDVQAVFTNENIPKTTS